MSEEIIRQVTATYFCKGGVLHEQPGTSFNFQAPLTGILPACPFCGQTADAVCAGCLSSAAGFPTEPGEHSRQCKERHV